MSICLVALCYIRLLLMSIYVYAIIMWRSFSMSYFRLDLRLSNRLGHVCAWLTVVWYIATLTTTESQSFSCPFTMCNKKHLHEDKAAMTHGRDLGTFSRVNHICDVQQKIPLFSVVSRDVISSDQSWSEKYAEILRWLEACTFQGGVDLWWIPGSWENNP
jgi:hypothetical protein